MITKRVHFDTYIHQNRHTHTHTDSDLGDFWVKVIHDHYHHSSCVRDTTRIVLDGVGPAIRQ